MIFPGWRRSSPSDVPDLVQAQPVQPARHRAHAAPETPAIGELPGDPVRGPLIGPSPVLDQLHHPRRQPGGAVGRSTGVVHEAGAAAVTVAGYPLRQSGPSDVELGRDVSDRASALEYLGDSSLSSKDGQRGITVGHGTGLFQQVNGFSTTHRAGQGPVPSSPHGDYNVMTRNN